MDKLADSALDVSRLSILVILFLAVIIADPLATYTQLSCPPTVG
jgi:hypothetical protein